MSCVLFAEDEVSIRNLATMNLTSGKKIPVVVIEGTVEVEDGIFEDFRYAQSGNNFLFEGDKTSLKKDQRVDEVTKLEKRKELLGNQDSSWLLFTGGRVAQYSPMGLSLLIHNTSTAPTFHHLYYLNPKNWGSLNVVPLGLMLPNMKLVELNDETVKFSLKVTSNKESIFSDIELQFSKRFGWNLSNAKFWGGDIGVYENHLEWRRQDNHWYPYKGTAKVGGSIDAQWEIKHISFSPSDLKTDFKIHEERLSGIMKYEGAPGTKQVQTILGGADGERQYRLLKAEQFLE